MLEQVIIIESKPPYNSSLWLVSKKGNYQGKREWRLVIDYMSLNENTISYKFPIPNILSILHMLEKSQYFTTLDLAKGFH